MQGSGARSLPRLLAIVLLLGSLLAIAYPASAAASPRMCFYTEDRQVIGGSLSGHAFVQLLPDSGPQAGKRDLVYGFSAKHTALAITGGPGIITSNATHAWNWKLCETVSQHSYNAAAGRIASDEKNPPEYALFKFNCTNWIFRIAAKAFVTLPSAKALGSETFFDPEVLGGKLKDMWVEQGSRNIPGGKVFRNSGNLSPTDAADPPSPFATNSYTDLALDAFSNPVALAHNLEMAVAQRRLSALRVGVGHDLVVSLRGVDPDEAITQVRFGDNAHSLQRSTFTHAYLRAGSYRVHGIAIAHSTVFSFSFTVTAGGGGSARTTIVVPNLRPPRPTPRPVPAPIVPQPL
jgi:hypothetical protein